MCRSIKTLREPYTEHVTNQDVRAAALQYVRKVSGFRSPAPHNAEAFDQAVAAVATATQLLLDQLQVRPARRAPAAEPPRRGPAAEPARRATAAGRPQ